jgi:hypothetical protein
LDQALDHSVRVGVLVPWLCRLHLQRHKCWCNTNKIWCRVIHQHLNGKIK